MLIYNICNTVKDIFDIKICQTFIEGEEKRSIWIYFLILGVRLFCWLPHRHHPPLSRSHSGEDAPLHSLRGPSTGEMRPKSDSDTVLGRSRLQGLDRGDGEDEEEEGVGEGEGEEDVQEEEEEELAKGQGDRSSWGLLGDEPRLQVERVSESSSDMMLLPPQASSSKQSDATARGRKEKERRGVRKGREKRKKWERKGDK